MGDKSWKAFERRISRDHGVERRPNTGERDGSDSMPHELFCFQMKLRKSVPKCIREWSDGICTTAAKEGKIGVLVVKEPGLRDDNALVVLRYKDWVDLHGK